jgi:hypothetical protein
MTKEEVYKIELQIAKEKNLTVKNVKLFRGHDGVGLSCDLYLNNKKVAYCFDDARGGELEVDPVNYTLTPVICQINKEINAYPKYKRDDLDMTFSHTLEYIINALVEKHEEDKQFQKDSKKGIIFKKEDGSIWTKSWKNTALAMVIGKYGEKGKSMIQDTCNEIQEKGYEILNKDYLNKIGIRVQT